jgi:hypothetical protein
MRSTHGEGPVTHLKLGSSRAALAHSSFALPSSFFRDGFSREEPRSLRWLPNSVHVPILGKDVSNGSQPAPASSEKCLFSWLQQPRFGDSRPGRYCPTVAPSDTPDAESTAGLCRAGLQEPVAVYNEHDGQPIGRPQLRPERERVVFRIAWTLMLLAVSGANADEGRPMTILARGPWPFLPTHSPAGIGTDRAPLTRVIRTENELAKAAGGGARITAAEAFKMASIDFEKDMILAVEDGTQPMVGVSGGGPPSAPYTVSIVRISRDEAGKTLFVRWRRLPKGKDEVLTRPLAAVLVERSDGEVKFVRLPDPLAKEKEPPVVGKEVTAVARAFWPDGWPPEAPRKEWFVRNEEELIDRRLRAPEPVLEKMRAEAKARYAKALKVSDIDFTKQMVVGVSGGVQPVGSRVEVTRAEKDAGAKTLTVYWKLHPPAKDKPTQGITHPAEVVLLDRFAGEIRFKEEPK